LYFIKDNLIEKYDDRKYKLSAPNERFAKMAGVTPQKVQCDFASFISTRTAVNIAPLRQADISV
jgi:hypothetical protein